jgi:glutaredoxin
LDPNEKYIVYSKENCSYCQQAKSLLLMRGKNFDVKQLNADYTIEQFRGWFPEQRTFPMVVLENEKNIGGFMELKEYLK